MDAETMHENLQDLEHIVDAVVHGDAQRARELATEHVYRFTAYMQGILTQNLNHD
jgi:DNA-binding GntR family transcriptional regulator